MPSHGGGSCGSGGRGCGHGCGHGHGHGHAHGHGSGDGFHGMRGFHSHGRGHFFSTRATANTGAKQQSSNHDYYKDLEAHTMKNQPNTSIFLAFLSVIYASMSVFANVLAAQVWHIGTLQLDAGILVYPLTYITLDVITEIYHKQIANLVVNWTCILNTTCMGALFICRYLPNVDGVKNVNLATALNFSAIIFIASIVATWFGGHVNNFVYEELRARTAPNSVNSRSWVSSMFGRLIDSLVFSAIAFLYRMPLLVFLKQFGSSFLAAVLIETVFCIIGIKGAIANSFKRQLKIQDENSSINP